MTYNKNTWANHDLITSQKLNNIEDGINDVIDRVTYGTGGAEQPTQPIHTPVYLNLGDPLPTDAVSGDYAFVKDGDDFTIMEFNGVKWVEQINPNLKERIADVLAQAEKRSQELVDENATAIGATLDEVQAKQADLSAQQAELDTKAKGYADKALADAKADTLAKATQTAKDASDALAKAKTDLTANLNKEVTDRANAVTALDTKAQGYATQAKTDAISASATADGVINKKIDDTASSITSTISQNKTDADGKITTAQTTAQQALDGLSTKVSQTVYDTKTGQLQTDLNTTTTTANQAKTDIVAIKSDNSKQDARMTTIESDANGTKTTVSNLQTDLGKANGSITTLQQRADGFDATVMKVNNLSVGGRNLYLNSKAVADSYGTNGNVKVTVEPFDSTTNMWHIVAPQSTDTSVGIYLWDYGKEKLPDNSDWSYSADIKGVGKAVQFGIELGNKNPVIGNVVSNWSRISQTGHVDKVDYKTIIMYFDTTGSPLDVYIKLPKLETGNTPTAWSPAPEDVDSATAKAQLTADQAITSLNNYKSDADGRISKAQADIIVNANAITTKVSQSDYNTKTGDLTTKVNTAQSTADSATSTIGSYKTSNDERVASAESKITANANAITQKVSQSDYNQKTGELSGKISEISQTASQISQSVSDVKAQVDGLSVGGRNLFLNSKKLSWSVASNGADGHIVAFDDTTNMLHITAPSGYGTGTGVYFYQDTEKVSSRVQNGQQWAMSFDIKGTGNFANGAYIGSEGSNNYNGTTGAIPADWERVHFTGTATQTGGAIILYFGASNVPLDVYIKLPKLELSNIATDWAPAPEDTDNKISTVSQTVDSISSIVSDPTTGLTKRVQTAEGTLSQVTGADIPALQKATYWQPFTSLDLNTYMKQGSFFFNSTEVKPNGPTTMTNWMYLVVEQGTSDSGRVVQTAWYDTQTDAKITYRRQYAGAWSPWYANDNDSVTTIAQTNGVIKQEISDRQNGDTNTLTQAKDFTTSSISNSESGMRSQITQTSDAILGKVGAVNLFSNSEFEKDYGYRTKNPGVTLSLDTKNQIGTQYNGTVNVAPTSTGWQGYWARNIEVQGGQKYSGSVLVHYTNGGVTGGNAVLDIWFIDKDGNRINQGTGGSRSIGTGQVSSPYWVKLYFEGVTAPDNAVNLQVSLLTNDKGVGQTAMFTQPMVTATEKLQPYTPNNDITTQLALLKDNWSIGIADNAGAITNGIVGNSTNMSLISNNVVINAPSTQIKGTAWINSAMIGNGAIGTAQIGDASITSAKIASLDVAKLTGNVSSFIQSNWNGIYSSVAIDGSGMKITTGGTVTTLDQWGTHWSRGNLNSLYGFGYWQDSSGKNTSSTGLYLGVTGSDNAFINILGTNGAAAAILAGSNFDYGANVNIVQGAFNFYTHVNIRERLQFKGNKWSQPSYIEINENNRTFNFFTGAGLASVGNYFYFNQNVISAGTFSSTSVLSKKIVDSPYTEDALGEISKTQLVNFAYKNRPDQNHVSPIIDDVNDTKEYYIPKTILGQDGEYVDMYSMVSMTWKALQQVNDRLKKLESR